LDEPTRGIDVAVKYEIYNIINKFAEQGIVVILISSELPEILGVSTRTIIMREGKIVSEFDSGSVTREDVAKYATGNE